MSANRSACRRDIRRRDIVGDYIIVLAQCPRGGVPNEIGPLQGVGHFDRPRCGRRDWRSGLMRRCARPRGPRRAACSVSVHRDDRDRAADRRARRCESRAWVATPLAGVKCCDTTSKPMPAQRTTELKAVTVRTRGLTSNVLVWLIISRRLKVCDRPQRIGQMQYITERVPNLNGSIRDISHDEPLRYYPDPMPELQHDRGSGL